MQLILPDSKYEASYKKYIKELGDEERYPFPLDFDHSDFSKLLKKLDNFSSVVAIINREGGRVGNSGSACVLSQG